MSTPKCQKFREKSGLGDRGFEPRFGSANPMKTLAGVFNSGPASPTGRENCFAPPKVGRIQFHQPEDLPCWHHALPQVGYYLYSANDSLSRTWLVNPDVLLSISLSITHLGVYFCYVICCILFLTIHT